ncbi:MAG: FAD-dependent oxidoreductase [Nitrososphaerota archaeon]|nr:FAD-dependent oxidoreductase [Nitrososphaerota archaeon]
MKYLSQIVSKTIDTDFLVIGGGLAGSVAGIILGAKGIGSVTLVDKGRVGTSGQTAFLAGNWAFKLPEEDTKVWIEEGIRQGEFMNDQDWVKLQWENVYEVTKLIDDWCAQVNVKAFKKDESGNFFRRKGRGNVKTTGYTLVNGLELMNALRKQLSAKKVKIVDRVQINELVTNKNGRICGAIGLHTVSGDIYLFRSKIVIIAASGCGFKSTFFGHQNLTGDLQAAAYKSGVRLRNMEFFSCNTGARDFDVEGMNLMVSIGGKLVNSKGEAFMSKYDPVLGSKANLEVITLASAMEVHQGRGPIYFDVTSATPEDQKLARQILWESFKTWDRVGIDPFKTRVPWISCFYGTLTVGGGIHINTKCETNISGVYAAGDVTPEPPQGTYCYGGVNVTFAAISGKVAGESAAKFFLSNSETTDWADDALQKEIIDIVSDMTRPVTRTSGISTEQAIKSIQDIIIPYKVSMIKSEQSLKDALSAIKSLSLKLESELYAKDSHDLMKANEARNMALIAKLMIQSSLVRTESRGFNLREDYPISDNTRWLKWVFVERDNADSNSLEPKFEVADIPMPLLRPDEQYATPPGIARTK